MFSNKLHVNILTALLLKHDVHHAVVCPGSRNAPIVHNLNEVDGITCYPVTDERSAGFYALGMCQLTHEPGVLCVTSGTALLNTLPAVAEAYYQHQPLIVISADRPAEWIDQMDGQTIPQPGALRQFVRKAVNLPEGNTDRDQWYCSRLVNEALIASKSHAGGPVHINVALSDPLYEYTEEELPESCKIELFDATDGPKNLEPLMERLLNAEHPMIVIGQMKDNALQEDNVQKAGLQAVVLKESLSPYCNMETHFDEVLARNGQLDGLRPDVVLYLGDEIVSKRLKNFLRTSDCEVWTVNDDGGIYDTFCHLRGVIECNPTVFFRLFDNFMHTRDISSMQELPACGQNGSDSDTDIMPERVNPSARDFIVKWKNVLQQASLYALEFQPDYSSMATVKYLEEQLEDMEYNCRIHFGNSLSVRLANIYAGHYVYCNRGINGIEGSLSTAAGMAAVTEDMVFCILGDLSFFYDQNALWNQNLKGNLRVIILNNHAGAIFGKFEGLCKSAARDKLIMARHEREAQGICTQNDCGYLKATNMEEMQLGIVQMLTMQTKRPVVLEVFTDAETDIQQLKNYFGK